MKPLDAYEFAQQLRLSDDSAVADYADKFLTALDFYNSGNYEELCRDVEHYTKESGEDAIKRRIEWLGDRSHLLDELEEKIREADPKFKGCIDAALVALISKLPPKLEYDL